MKNFLYIGRTTTNDDYEYCGGTYLISTTSREKATEMLQELIDRDEWNREKEITTVFRIGIDDGSSHPMMDNGIFRIQEPMIE